MEKNKLSEGWKEVELGKIFTFQKKSTIKAGEGLSKGKYKFFTSSDKQSKFIDKYTQDGEFLIFATGGHAGIHYCNERFATSTDCFIAKIDNKIMSKYVYYYLFSQIQILEEGFKGAGLKHISKGYIEDIKIIYPENKETQKKIVSILEKVEKAKEWRKVADDLTKDFLKSIFLEMFGDPVKNPKKWPKEILDTNSERICVSYVGPCNQYYTNKENGVPMIRTGNLKENNLNLSDLKYVTKEFHEKQKKSQLNEGDLLIARHGTNGQAALVTEKLGISNCLNVVIVRPNKQKYNPLFLGYCFNTKSNLSSLGNKLGGSTQNVINTRAIQSHEIIRPDIELQNKFASIVKKVEVMKEQQKHSKNQIDKLFNALMQKAFKGELII
jgi:type I restriction enzyme, S subunit